MQIQSRDSDSASGGGAMFKVQIWHFISNSYTQSVIRGENKVNFILNSAGARGNISVGVGFFLSYPSVHIGKKQGICRRVPGAMSPISRPPAAHKAKDARHRSDERLPQEEKTKPPAFKRSTMREPPRTHMSRCYYTTIKNICK